MKNTNQKPSGISPAALVAALSGDMGNFLVASTPGGIEAQEKAGQMREETRETLPMDLGQRRGGSIEDARKPWIALGFEFGNPVDGIFVDAKFPAGWAKRPTDHSMWSDIVDSKGRVRGSIFYKAAFYDRSAHAHLSPRFSIDNDYAKPISTISVKDKCGDVDFKMTVEYPDWSGDRAEAQRREDKKDVARNDCIQFLRANYPDFENPCAYWDEIPTEASERAEGAAR